MATFILFILDKWLEWTISVLLCSGDNLPVTAQLTTMSSTLTLVGFSLIVKQNSKQLLNLHTVFALKKATIALSNFFVFKT